MNFDRVCISDPPIEGLNNGFFVLFCLHLPKLCFFAKPSAIIKYHVSQIVYIETIYVCQVECYTIYENILLYLPIEPLLYPSTIYLNISVCFFIVVLCYYVQQGTAVRFIIHPNLTIFGVKYFRFGSIHN